MMNEVLTNRLAPAWRWAAVVGAAVALLLSGCGGAAGGAVKTVVQQQAAGSLTIALEAPERPQVLAEHQVVITLVDQAGEPVDGAEVWLALIMPSMRMRSNEPDATPLGGGRYRAKAIFTMSGAWNLEVHAMVHSQDHVAMFYAQTS